MIFALYFDYVQYKKLYTVEEKSIDEVTYFYVVCFLTLKLFFFLTIA